MRNCIYTSIFFIFHMKDVNKGNSLLSRATGWGKVLEKK